MKKFELVCLNCTLPICDESHSECLYITSVQNHKKELYMEREKKRIAKIEPFSRDYWLRRYDPRNPNNEKFRNKLNRRRETLGILEMEGEDATTSVIR